MFGELLSAPFKVAGGVLSGFAKAADNIINHEENDEEDVYKTIASGGLADVGSETFKAFKKAVDDIAKS